MWNEQAIYQLSPGCSIPHNKNRVFPSKVQNLDKSPVYYLYNHSPPFCYREQAIFLNSLLLVAFHYEACVLSVNMGSSGLETQDWAGRWKVGGSIYNGNRRDIRIRKPMGLAATHNKTFVTLFGVGNIIGIEKHSGQSSVFLSLEFVPRRLVVDPSNHFLYIGLQHGLAKCDVEDASTLGLLFGSKKSGSGIGSLSATQFDRVNGLVMMDDDTLLAADYFNDR